MPDFHVDPRIKPLFDAIVNKDTDALAACLAEDVVFRPPTYWKDWEGRDVAVMILSNVVEVLDDFHYVRVFNEHPSYAFEFHAKVGDLNAEGIDLLTVNDDGLVTDFTVVMRPLKTVQALREEMTKRLGMG